MIKRIALIPARSGSERIVGKNVRIFFGHPLIAYSIRAAIDSKIFDEVVCVTDSQEYASVALNYGASVPSLRPLDTALSDSPDVSWVSWIMGLLEKESKFFEVFCILRPTSPFRRPQTIQRAWNLFTERQPADSLRAIRKCNEHPGKMWTIQNEYMIPLINEEISGTPWHSNQTSALPEVYVQDASLEFSWTRNLKEGKGISGSVVIPFISENFEGFDINTPYDWDYAESLILNGLVDIPRI